MSTLEAGSSTRTTRSPSVSSKYACASENNDHQPPGRFPSGTAAMAAMPALVVPYHDQQQTPSSRRALSTAAAPPSMASRRTGGYSRNIPSHTSSSSPAPPRLVESLTRAAPCGGSQPQPQPPRTQTVEPNQKFHFPSATAHAFSPRHSQTQQLTSSASPYTSRADHAARHSTATQAAPFGGVCVSRPSHASSPVFSLSRQPQANSVAAVRNSSTLPPSPTTSHQRRNSLRVLNTGSRDVDYVVSTAPVRHTRQFPLLSQQSLTQRPIVYSESMADIPISHPDTQLRSRPVTVLQERTTSSPLLPPARPPSRPPAEVRNPLFNADFLVPPPPPPSLLLSEHRHVRLTCAENRRSAPALSYPHQPPQQQQQHITLLETHPPSASSSPPPRPPQENHDRLTTQPTAQLVETDSRRTLQDNTCTATVADDTSGFVQETCRTRERCTPHPLRSAPVTANGIPVGSPYGAIPTYAIVTPLSDIRAFLGKSLFSASAHYSPPAPGKAAPRSAYSADYPTSSSRPLLQEDCGDPFGIPQGKWGASRENRPTLPVETAVESEWSEKGQDHDSAPPSMEKAMDSKTPTTSDGQPWGLYAFVPSPMTESTRPAAEMGMHRLRFTDAKRAAPPPHRHGADLPHVPAASERARLDNDSPGEADEATPTEANESSLQPQSEDSPHRDDVDGLGEFDDRRVYASYPSWSSYDVATNSRSQEITDGSQSPMLGSHNSSHHFTLAPIQGQTTSLEQDTEEGWCSTSSSGVGVAAAERGGDRWEEAEKWTSPPPEHRQPAAMEVHVSRKYSEQPRVAAHDPMHQSTTHKKGVARCGSGSGSDSDSDSGTLSGRDNRRRSKMPQDVDDDVVDTPEKSRKGQEALGSLVKAGEDCTETVLVTESTTEPLEASATTASMRA